MTYEECEQRIEALTFYGTGSEPYEMFSAVCGLAYQLHGCGIPESHALAAQCVIHAEFLAARSKEYADEGDLEDTAQGYWGYA